MPTSKPDMSIIWAVAGSSVKPSDAKIQEGWTAEKPPFQTENWSQQRQDQYLNHIDERGIPEWDNKSQYVLGGICWFNDQIWESLIVNNLGNQPIDGQGFWLSQNYVDRRGDSMSGELVLNKGSRLNKVDGDPNTSTQTVYLNNLLRARFGLSEAVAIEYITALYDVSGVKVAELKFTPAGELSINGFKVWTLQNDGPGSGLNADLLDGMHAADIINTVSSNRTVYDIPGSYFFTVPTNVYTVFLSVCSAGGGGWGGGDIFVCATPPDPLAPLPCSISGQKQVLNIFSEGAIRSTEVIANGVITTELLNSFSRIGGSTGIGNPVKGGDGANSFFGNGGISDSRFGGPYPEWNGTRGAGGAGGGGNNDTGGYGGISGTQIIGVPFLTNPGEQLTIVVADGSIGSTGCRSTGGKGGDGYIELVW